MKRIVTILFAILITTSLTAQRTSKEEKKAAAKAAHELAVKCVEQRSFVIVPTTYTDSNGEVENNIDNANFFSVEGENLFAQGNIVCGNSYTNILEATEYEATFNKKGNMKLRIVVNGRMLKGTYTISMSGDSNEADVIFTPQSGSTRKFSGLIMPLSASYNKRANPM